MAEEKFRGGNPEVAIVVRDLETMTRFYGEAVGLEHIVDLELVGCLMRRFACGHGVVKLLRLDEIPEESNPPGGVPGGTGLRYLTIEVNDLEAVSRRCRAAGAGVAYPVQTASTGSVYTILEDPEGNWLELVTRP